MPDSPSPAPQTPESQIAALQQELAELRLAYQMAVEMGQFKIGFLARSSHELRSPLNGLIGMHQLILSDLCENPEEEREFVSQANTAAQKLVKMLDEVLTVAKADYGTLPVAIQPVPLAIILQQVVDLVRLPAQDRNLRLHLTPPDGSVYVLADPNWLRQALLGLVDTTLLLMPEGSLSISVGLEATTANVWIDAQCPVSGWSDPLTLLEQEPTQEFQPSPTFRLLLSQRLLARQGATVEIVAAGNGETLPTRLECTIPLVNEAE